MGSQIVERSVYLGANCIISALGIGTDENVKGVESYTTKTTRWNLTNPICTIDWNRISVEAKRFGLCGFTKIEQIAILTVQSVLEQTALTLDNGRSLLIFSTTKGDIDAIESHFEKSQLNYTANRVASYFGAAVEPLVISNACISGVSSIIVGSRLIQNEQYDHVIVVGFDLISEFIVTGFNSFKSLSQSLCRPYDATRDGLTLGEACAALLLTSNPSGEGCVEVAGGAISNDANHISGPSRSGEGLYLAIRKAMEEAGVSASAIDFVNAHGTATLYNDEMESKALALANLEEKPLNSLKPYFGHTLGASGVLETIFCAEQLRKGVVYGVKGFQESGTSQTLNVSAQHRAVESHYCLKTASGFGGCNAALVLKQWEPAIGGKREHDVLIEELKTIHLSGEGEKSFAEFIREEYKNHCAPNMKFYKMDDLCKLGYVATEQLLKGFDLGCDAADVAIILSNRSSSAESDLRHQKMVNEMNVDEISPAVFVYTLPNIVAGEIAIRDKIKGETTFFVSSQKNSNFVENYSKLLLQRGMAKVALFGWCELLAEKYDVELKLIKIKN